MKIYSEDGRIWIDFEGKEMPHLELDLSPEHEQMIALCNGYTEDFQMLENLLKGSKFITVKL